VVREDREGLLPKGLDDLGGGGRTDALYGAGGQVFEHLGDRARHLALTEFRPKLAAKRRVFVPVAGEGQFLARRDLREHPDDRDEFPVLGREVQDRKAGVLLAEDDLLGNAV